MGKLVATEKAVPSSVEEDLVSMLVDDNKRMREAGGNLAIAALQVIHEYDGVHRLALAVANWSKAIADEGGRPFLHRSSDDP